MPSPEERAMLTDVLDRLIELYVAQNEARQESDSRRVETLQAEIDRLREKCVLLQHPD